MRKTILLCLSLLLSISEISAQVYKVDGSLYDTIYAIIEHEGVKLRLVTTVYLGRWRINKGARLSNCPKPKDWGVSKRYHETVALCQDTEEICLHHKWPMGEVSNHTCAWVVGSAERPAVLLYGWRLRNGMRQGGRVYRNLFDARGDYVWRLWCGRRTCRKRMEKTVWVCRAGYRNRLRFLQQVQHKRSNNYLFFSTMKLKETSLGN